ncbi:MAG TPA: MgtC/SapB family protein [Terracidiphilus sp.]|nr:MgtC/SapB family protein [Terracidiphilus sp.]HUX28720.1 MgtC/SapB family protein [Terracidiphilus sp.]
MAIYELLPPEAVKIVLVLFLSFLLGLEREEHKAEGHYSFGGVRTFPLIGLIGYSLALMSGTQLVPLTIGFLVIGGFLLLSYWHKLSAPETTGHVGGVTTEMSGMATFLVGSLIYYEHFWIATTITVASLLLLDLKVAFEKLATNIAPNEIFTFAKFLLLSGVILPALPNQEFGQFHINPFKTWLVVVAISAISYASYVLQKMTKGQGGIVLAALLGGAYSSTATTVVMAKRAAREEHPHLFAGGILIASGVMYLRLVALLALFNHQLMAVLLVPFLVLAAAALGFGWLWSRRADENTDEVKREYEPKNPLELLTAFMFAGLFLAMLVITQLAVTYLGKGGVDTLAAIMGVSDVDPFIMGLTQAAGALTPVKEAAGAILIAAASNNAVKGIYAYSLADKKTGRQSLLMLIGLAVAGLIPLIWLG